MVGGIGSYVVGECLGVGGMGTVFAAYSSVLETTVAVKFLHRKFTHDARARTSFEAEAIAGRVVVHPGVVAVLDHGETGDGQPFIVLERAAGEPLGQRVAREGALAPARAIALTRKILDALAAIHDAGIVHGDVKSDNVLVGVRGECKLIDFGLAQVQFSRQRGDRSAVPADYLSGTPDYMAPEVIRGHGASFAGDLYAVGVILYELLVGRTPFGSGTVPEILRRHLDDEVVPPSLRCEDYELPSSVDYVILRALRKSAYERYGRARDFDDALARLEHAAPARPATSSSSRARVGNRRVETATFVARRRRAGPELASAAGGPRTAEDHEGGEPCGHAERSNGGGRGS